MELINDAKIVDSDLSESDSDYQMSNEETSKFYEQHDSDEEEDDEEDDDDDEEEHKNPIDLEENLKRELEKLDLIERNLSKLQQSYVEELQRENENKQDEKPSIVESPNHKVDSKDVIEEEGDEDEEGDDDYDDSYSSSYCSSNNVSRTSSYEVDVDSPGKKRLENFQIKVDEGEESTKTSISIEEEVGVESDSEEYSNNIDNDFNHNIESEVVLESGVITEEYQEYVKIEVNQNDDDEEGSELVGIRDDNNINNFNSNLEYTQTRDQPAVDNDHEIVTIVNINEEENEKYNDNQEIDHSLQDVKIEENRGNTFEKEEESEENVNLEQQIQETFSVDDSNNLSNLSNLISDEAIRNSLEEIENELQAIQEEENIVYLAEQSEDTIEETNTELEDITISLGENNEEEDVPQEPKCDSSDQDDIIITDANDIDVEDVEENEIIPIVVDDEYERNNEALSDELLATKGQLEDINENNNGEILENYEETEYIVDENKDTTNSTEQNAENVEEAQEGEQIEEYNENNDNTDISTYISQEIIVLNETQVAEEEIPTNNEDTLPREQLLIEVQNGDESPIILNLNSNDGDNDDHGDDITISDSNIDEIEVTTINYKDGDNDENNYHKNNHEDLDLSVISEKQRNNDEDNHQSDQSQTDLEQKQPPIELKIEKINLDEIERCRSQNLLEDEELTLPDEYSDLGKNLNYSSPNLLSSERETLSFSSGATTQEEPINNERSSLHLSDNPNIRRSVKDKKTKKEKKDKRKSTTDKDLPSNRRKKKNMFGKFHTLKPKRSGDRSSADVLSSFQSKDLLPFPRSISPKAISTTTILSNPVTKSNSQPVSGELYVRNVLPPNKLGNDSDPMLSLRSRTESISVSAPPAPVEFIPQPLQINEDIAMEVIKSMNERRKKVAIELLTTETTYVNNLRDLLKVFYEPMLANATGLDSNRRISLDDVKHIFSNLRVILNVNTMLEASLAQRINVPEDCSVDIGDVFLTQAEYLKTYTIYCNEFGNILGIIKKLRENPDFESFFLSLHNKSIIGDQTIKSYLILPVQRIPRYKMLLNEMLKLTWKSHRDYQPLTDAYQKISQIAQFVENAAEKQQNVNKIVEIQSKFKNLGKKHESLKLLQPHRSFHKEVEIEIFDYSINNKKRGRKMIVFNDMILIVKIIWERDRDKKQKKEFFEIQYCFYLHETNSVTPVHFEGKYSISLLVASGLNLTVMFMLEDLRDEVFSTLTFLLKQQLESLTNIPSTTDNSPLPSPTSEIVEKKKKSLSESLHPISHLTRRKTELPAPVTTKPIIVPTSQSPTISRNALSVSSNIVELLPLRNNNSNNNNNNNSSSGSGSSNIPQSSLGKTDSFANTSFGRNLVIPPRVRTPRGSCDDNVTEEDLKMKPKNNFGSLRTTKKGRNSKNSHEI